MAEIIDLKQYRDNRDATTITIEIAGGDKAYVTLRYKNDGSSNYDHMRQISEQLRRVSEQLWNGANYGDPHEFGTVLASVDVFSEGACRVWQSDETLNKDGAIWLCEQLDSAKGVVKDA